MLPLFGPKQTFARIDYLQQDGRMVGKEALIVLNFSPETRQNNDYAMYKLMGIGYSKHESLRPLARVVARHADHGQ